MIGKWVVRGAVLLGLIVVACTQGAPPRALPAPAGARASAPAPAKSSSLVRDEQPIPFDATPLVEAKKPPIAPPEPEPPHARPRVTPYALPVRASRVVNLARDVDAKTALWDPKSLRRPLLRDGMAVVDAKGAPERFGDAYTSLSRNGVPILVTVDSLLHLYHVYYDQILKAIELRVLSPLLTSLLDATYDELLHEVVHAGGTLQNAALIAVAYVSVARALLEPGFHPPAGVATRVDKDVQRALQHRGFEKSDAMSVPHCLEPGCYNEDFSQYVPRGHYTQSPALKRYFRASMWLGRIVFHFSNPREVASQALILQALGHAKARFRGKQVPAAQLLSRIDHVLDYFVGETDDLGAFDVSPVLSKQIAAGSDLHALLEPRAARRVSKALRALRAPRILSGAVQGFAKDAEATVKQTQGFRLLGQRYAPDSDLLGRLVYEFTGPDPRHPRFAEVARSVSASPCPSLSPAELGALDHPTCDKLDAKLSRCICKRAIALAGTCQRNPRCAAAHPEAKNESFDQVCRLMPSGLDVASVLGSARARKLSRPAERYCRYAERRKAQSEYWQNHPADTLYADWLDVLRPLLARPGRGYPVWMRGNAFQKLSLTTGLASWSELRHDTILYVKQSYTAAHVAISGTSPLLPPGYYATVEPEPEVIARLQRLSDKTRKVLGALGVLPKGVGSSLDSLDRVLARLHAITEKELAGHWPDPHDASFLMGIGDTFDGLVTGLASTLGPPPDKNAKVPPGMEPATSVDGMDEATRTTLVADVHTDPNTGRVLEEAVGPVRWLLAVNRRPDGTLSVSAGPVFSHYEFVERMGNRLTDKKWRKLLKQNVIAPSASRPIANGLELPCAPDTCRKP